MLLNEKLIASENNVVIVAARGAWPMYKEYHAYICQPERSFQRVHRMGFYADGAIQSLVPRITEKHVYERVEFRRGIHKGPLGDLVNKTLSDGKQREGQIYKVMFLSDPDSTDTYNLENTIPNDITTETGRTWAFTLSQRYVSFDRLKKAKRTSDLVVQ